MAPDRRDDGDDKLRALRVSLTTALASLKRSLPGDRPRVLVMKGSYSPSPSLAERLLVVLISDRLPQTVADLWLAPEDYDGLLRGLGERTDLFAGECDAMYATDWTIGWGQAGGGRFEAWRRRGRLLASELAVPVELHEELG